GRNAADCGRTKIPNRRGCTGGRNESGRPAGAKCDESADSLSALDQVWRDPNSGKHNLIGTFSGLGSSTLPAPSLPGVAVPGRPPNPLSRLPPEHSTSGVDLPAPAPGVAIRP